jgi:hypothetical protein
MNWIRTTAFCRWLTIGLIGMVVNLSIDPPDREAPGLPEDSSFNDIESIAELITEQIFGLTDFFPEGDEPDDEGGFAKKLVEFRCAGRDVLLQIDDHQFHLVIGYPFAEAFTAQYEPTPLIPPPWA